VIVSVVKIRIVRMTVADGCVPVRVAMGRIGRRSAGVLVLMMLVM
jgi:hypothetical protein